MSASEFAYRLGAAARRPASWWQLIKFGLVGGSGYLINLGVFAFLSSNLGVHHLIAHRLHDYSALLPELSFASRDFH